MVFANDFDRTKNLKLVPKWKGPAEFIDINYTNAKVKFKSKTKVLNVSKLKHFFLFKDISEEKEEDAHSETLIEVLINTVTMGQSQKHASN